VNSIYSLACMFAHMYSLLYEFLCNFYITPLPLIAAGPVGTPVNFDSLLPDQDLTQKSPNKLSNVPNNNENILQNVRKVYQLYTRCTAQLAIGGPVTGEVLYQCRRLIQYGMQTRETNDNASQTTSRVHQEDGHAPTVRVAPAPVRRVSTLAMILNVDAENPPLSAHRVSLSLTVSVSTPHSILSFHQPPFPRPSASLVTHPLYSRCVR